MALHFLAESAFDDLLASWREYDRVRKIEPTDVPKLGEARIRLDDARSRMNKIRLAMYPNKDERDGSLIVALCPTLDRIVHLSWTHSAGPGSRQLHCPCGHVVPMPKTAGGRLVSGPAA